MQNLHSLKQILTPFYGRGSWWCVLDVCCCSQPSSASHLPPGIGNELGEHSLYGSARARWNDSGGMLYEPSLGPPFSYGRWAYLKQAVIKLNIARHSRWEPGVLNTLYLLASGYWEPWQTSWFHVVGWNHDSLCWFSVCWWVPAT